MLTTPRLSSVNPLMLVALVGHAQTRAPSAIELHTAYCIPVVKAELKAAQQAVAAQDKSLAEITAASGSAILIKAATDVLDNLRGEESRYRALLGRLQSHLLPRISELDPAALLDAENRGKSDAQTISRQGMDKDLAVRLKSCNSPTWLPS